jgi:hypothetical protein
MEQEGLIGKLVSILDDNATADFSVTREAGSAIVTQATEGVAKLSARIGKAAAGAIWKKIKSSVADRKFEQQWARAKSRTEQEFAVRQLIESSPKLARDLNELLQQRAYLIAVREHCQELPFLSSVFPGVSIRDVSSTCPFDSKAILRPRAAIIETCKRPLLSNGFFRRSTQTSIGQITRASAVPDLERACFVVHWLQNTVNGSC